MKEPPLAGIQKRTGREPLVLGWLFGLFQTKMENPSHSSESVL
jgi:hypothetical protein